MTTITREDWDTLQRIAGRIGGRFVLNDGITIADPEPPEGVVKLAREICQSHAYKYSETQPAYDSGGYDELPEMSAAIAAIMHARKAVESAESALHISFGVETALPESVRRADILRQLGGAHKQSESQEIRNAPD